MSYIYKGKTDWIKQPDQTVSVFPSGLCLIQHSYLIRKDNFKTDTFVVGDRLSDEDASMCVDGAFIFPAPQYSDTGNGFMRCLISAYGRVNTTGTSFSAKRLSGYLSTITTIAGAVSTTATSTTQQLFDAISYQFVVKKNEVVGTPYVKLYIYDPLSGLKLPEGASSVSTTSYRYDRLYELGASLDRYETSDYGVFQEVVITNVASGQFSEKKTQIAP
jgi:hypothetical protein